MLEHTKGNNVNKEKIFFFFKLKNFRPLGTRNRSAHDASASLVASYSVTKGGGRRGWL